MPKNNIKINIYEDQANNRVQLTYLSSQFFIASFFYLMGVIAFLDAFKFPDVSFYGILVGLIPIGFFFFIKNKTVKTYGGLGFLLFMTLMFIIFNKYTVNGFFLSLNHFADIVGTQTTYLLPKYKILLEPESFKLAINLFMIYLFMLVSYLSYLIVNKGLSYLVWPFMILILILQLITGIYFNIYLNIGLFLASVLIINTSFINKKSSAYHLREGKSSTSFLTSIVLMSLFVLTLLIAFAIQPQADYEKNTYIKSVEEKAGDRVDDLRYEKNAPDSLTQGDFLKLTELKLTDSEALEIIMEEPNPYYLRGFIGADYSRNTWSELANEAIYENYGLFYSLNESGFRPLTQLSLVDEITRKKDDNPSTHQMSINNLNTHSKYLYTPYEIDDSLTEIEDLHYFNESHLISKEFKGKRQYSFNVSEDLVTRYPAIANRLYKNKDKEVVKTYLDYEAYYNQYVYDYYTDLPEEVENVLAIHFGKKSEDETHLAYEQAIEQVKEYLEETIEYNEKPKELNRDRDFLSFIIEESREGYAPHYATTGTLLFRYLGIPARYVEGYLVTPDVIKDKEAYDKLTITGQEAHAWTEIYFDEIGWIPIEVTPEYEDVMPDTDMTDYPKGEWSDEEEKAQREKEKEENEALENEVDDPEVEDIEEDQLPESDQNDDGDGSGGESEDNDGSNEDDSESEDEDVLTEDLEEDQSEFLKYLLILLLIILLLLILIYLIYLIKKRLELRRLIQSFVGSDLNKATTLITSYSLILLHYVGIKERQGSIKAYEKDVKKVFGSDYAREFSQMLKINQAAVYSGKETTKEDHAFVLEFKDKLLTKITKEKTYLQKVKMRFWDFIY